MNKKKYYLTLDTETATLGFSDSICKDEVEKQKISIMRPIVYDIGWVISDRVGNIVKKVNYLVQETFFVPTIFFTAYYKDKRPFYMEELAKGTIGVKNWDSIAEELAKDMETVDLCTAYNAAFDFKKAIPFTEEYISALYSPDYVKWEMSQRRLCEKTLSNPRKYRGKEDSDFLDPVFRLRGAECPIADLWAVACDRLINIDKYRSYCLENSLLTNSKVYFKTSAETAYQYLMNQYDFVENHTALSDAEIENEILMKALKRGKVEPILKAFPFKELGSTYDFAMTKKKQYIPTLIDELDGYIEKLSEGGYKSKLENVLAELLTAMATN
jgi:hypothetical protein